MVSPFVILLLLIALGPVAFPKYWKRNYKSISIFLSALVIGYYIFIKKNIHDIETAGFDYFSFISLLSALFVVSGSIFIKLDFKPSPFVNTLILFTGAVLANFIGTTGASILLIRPFIQLNEHRIKPYLIVFFIFLVSNVGGGLTPMGPPLFLGYLRGIPFEWMIHNIFYQWLFVVGLLLTIFIFFDSRNNKKSVLPFQKRTGTLRIEGLKNLIWLILIMLTVFLDPAKIHWLPSFHGHSFVREILQGVLLFACYIFCDKKILVRNKFHWEPILEVGFLFFGIFFTMIPALTFLSDFTNQYRSTEYFNPGIIFWSTGIASSFLDNAPAYLTFLTVVMSYFNLAATDNSSVYLFSQNPEYIIYLKAISMAAVFFGAITYIGNGPNFIVKSIAEDMRVEMPSFFRYIWSYAFPILLPILALIWLIFL
ncbi:MAG: sodium:proton antiporter [Chitinophagales bacterium]|nr:sodium:proton antiporter [Chitinophagales bacterium]